MSWCVLLCIASCVLCVRQRSPHTFVQFFFFALIFNLRVHLMCTTIRACGKALKNSFQLWFSGNIPNGRLPSTVELVPFSPFYLMCVQMQTPRDLFYNFMHSFTFIWVFYCTICTRISDFAAFYSRLHTIHTPRSRKCAFIFVSTEIQILRFLNGGEKIVFQKSK